MSDGVRLVVGGAHPKGIGPGAPGLGRLPVAEDEAVAGVSAVPAGLVVQVQRTQPSEPQPSSKIYLLRHDGAVVLLGAADEVVVRHDGNAVFALRYGTSGPGAPGVLSELAPSGRVLARHSVPGGLGLQADTATGLLVAVAPATGAEFDLRVLDRPTLAVRQRLGKVSYVLGATSTRAAWIPPGCALACDLVVAELPAGARHTVALAKGYSPGDIAFAPDGRRVAIGYFGRHPQQPGGSAPGFVEVVDLASGARQRVPGVASGVKQVADLSWTPDGRWLAIAVGWPDLGFRRVGLWPAHGGRLQLLPGRFLGGYPPAALLAL